MNLVKCGYAFGLALVFWAIFPYIENANSSEKLLQARTGEERKAEADRLLDQGVLQYQNGMHYEALRSWQQALLTYQKINNRKGVSNALSNLTIFYQGSDQYNKAIEYGLLYLTTTREMQDKQGEISALDSLGSSYHLLSNYEKAIEYYKQSLSIIYTIKDEQAEGKLLGNIGNTYYSLGDYGKAIEYHQRSLAIAYKNKDKQTEGKSLGNIGISYFSLRDYEKALEYYQQSLRIAREINDKKSEGANLGNIGIAYQFLADYEKAIEYVEKSLIIANEINNKKGEGQNAGTLGSIHISLGNHKKAITYFRQQLVIARKISDKQSEGNALGSIGSAYKGLNEYEKAIDYHQQSLAIMTNIKNAEGISAILGNLGIVYRNIGDYSKAIEYEQKHLALARKIKDTKGESSALSNLGNINLSLDNYDKAIAYQHQSLIISRGIKDAQGEGTDLHNIGAVFTKQNKIEFAILFYKQSVNTIESIRKKIRGLNLENQQFYKNTVVENYRFLADRLLQQDRVMEALQVLDLLKVQDLQDFLKDIKGNERTALGVEMLPQEQKIINQYNIIQNQAIQLGRELIDLRKIPTLTTFQQQRLKEIEQIQQQVNQQLTAFLQSPSTTALINQIQQTAAQQNTTLLSYQDLSARVQKLGKGTALFYPLILDNRIELVLFIPNHPPIHRSIAIKQTELENEIKTFRQQLEARHPSIENISQKLYQKLIAPIEPDLQAAKIQTIVYAPDGPMRYVPLAALHDGKQWLAEKYLVNNVTAVSLTNLEPALQQKSQVLAGAFVTGKHSFNVDDKLYEFSGLKFAGEEVSNLAQTIPNTTKLIDSQFSRTAVIPNLKANNIIHLATHAAFVAGSPNNSFILLGNGDRISLREVADWDLPSVSLVVLSACQTALGDKLGNGIEILGFGYQLQRAKVRASIASLWTVSDGGTQELMAAFYTALKTGQISHAEALRQAQVAMITGNKTVLGKPRGLIKIVPRPNLPPPSNQLSHPYYWAPFIMIGNGL